MKVLIKLFWMVVLTAFLLSGCGKSIEEQVAEQLELGNRYLSELDYEQAIVAFVKAIEIDPKNVEAYLCLCEAYMEAGNFDEAVAQLELGYEQTGDKRILQKLQEYRISLSEEDLKVFQELYRMMEDEDYKSAMSYIGEHQEMLGGIFRNQMSEKLYLFDGSYTDKNLNKTGMVLYVKERKDKRGYAHVDYYLFYGEFIDAEPNGTVSYVWVICDDKGEIQGEEYLVAEWVDGYLNGPGHAEYGQFSIMEGKYSFMHIWDGDFANDALTGERKDISGDYTETYQVTDGYVIENEERYYEKMNPWPKDISQK